VDIPSHPRSMKIQHASYRIDRWRLSPKRKRAAPNFNVAMIKDGITRIANGLEE
jgi:hypothetical protein